MIAFDNLHGQFPSKRPEKKYFLSWILMVIFMVFYFFFAESLDPQVACQATFFPTLTRLLSPLPMSLGPVPLLPRLLRSSTRWPPTLNWAMNNPKIRPHAANHSNHQVIHVLIIDGAFLPLITITNCSESFDWRIGRLSWSDYSGRKTCTIHH